MRRFPSLLFRLLGVSAALGLAASCLFKSREEPHAAFDPSDPAADPAAGPSPVRSAGPQSMRDRDGLTWDSVDEAADESFPASDPPSSLSSTEAFPPKHTR